MTVQQVRSPGGATEAKQNDILTALAAVLIELGQKLEQGQQVALDAPTLAALESITATISNLPSDYPLPDAQVIALAPQIDALTDVELRATPVPISGTVSVNEPVTVDGTVSSGEKYDLIPYAQELVASDTITPASGKRLQVLWAQVMADPDASAGNLVSIGFSGGATLYKAYGLARSAVFVGDVDQALNVTLENGEKVTVNIQYREIA